jgi:hypothetical protein
MLTKILKIVVERVTRRIGRSALAASVVIGATSALATGHPGCAQGLIDAGLQGIPGPDDGQGVTVMSRTRPALDPLGTRFGSFLFLPSLGLGFGGNSAVTPGHGSWLAQATPALSLASDWDRDRVSADISATRTQYLDLPAQDTTDWPGCRCRWAG